MRVTWHLWNLDFLLHDLHQELGKIVKITTCPCRPLGPPATVTPGRLLVSPVSPHKGRTNWLLSPSATTRRPAPEGVVVVVLVVVVVVVLMCAYNKGCLSIQADKCI